MSVLFPAMLAGVIGLAGPVLLHLIARHRFPIQTFPSTRFLRLERRTNVFAWKLIDVPQLILRLIVLLLLVLAMSRLFAPWFSSRPAPRNLVVVVDASASMRAMVKSGEGQQRVIERARAVARSLLNEVEPPSRCALISAAASTDVLRGLGPDADEAVRALATVAPSDGAGAGLVNAVAEACEMVRGRREVKSQVVVITDMRSSAFAVRTGRDLARIRGVRDQLGDALDIVIVNVADEAVKNVAIVDVYRKGKEIQVGDDAHVIARILNSGEEEVHVAPRLAIGGETAPAPRARPVPPGAEIVMDLTTRMNRVVYSFAEVRLKETDALLHDNVRHLPLQVADTRRVLIVNGATGTSRAGAGAEALGALTGGGDDDDERGDEIIDGAMILRYVLNPGRELGLAYGTGIASTLVSPSALAAQALSKYDIIVLYDVSSLPEKAMADLDTFVRQGRALVLVASAAVNPMRFNRTLASGSTDRGALSPAQVGNDIELTPPSGIASDATAHPLLAVFRDRRRGDLSVIRFTRIREVRGMPEDARVMFADDAGHPLAIERQVERGRVVLLTFGFELSRGNIARTRAFPPLAWRLTGYLAGRLEAPPADTLVALRKSVVAVREPQFAFVDELELSAAAVHEATDDAGGRVKKSDAGAVLLEGLPAGQYLLRAPRRDGAPRALGYARRISVNVDAGESDMRAGTREDLEEAFGAEVRIIGPADEARVTPRGAELFGLLVVLLIMAYAAEAGIGFYLSAQREKARSAGAAS